MGSSWHRRNQPPPHTEFAPQVAGSANLPDLSLLDVFVTIEESRFNRFQLPPWCRSILAPMTANPCYPPLGDPPESPADGSAWFDPAQSIPTTKSPDSRSRAVASGQGSVRPDRGLIAPRP